MTPWAIRDNKLILDGISHDSNIRRITNSLNLQQIEVVLCNGRKFSLHLVNYGNSEGIELPTACRSSRTLFLKWLKDEKVIGEEFLSKRLNESREVYDFTDEYVGDELSSEDWNDESSTLPRNEDPMATADKRKVDSDEIISSYVEKSVESVTKDTPETIVTNPDRLPKSTDTDSIKSHLIGKNVLVHVSNLAAPSDHVKVRDIDESHVKTLEQTLTKSGRIFTVLLGLVSSRDIEDLKLPGKGRVEVIGGNHTRQALVNMEKNTCVIMDLYYNLTNIQALRLGWMHNELHTHSKQTSFEEQVRLFRGILKRLERELVGKSKKAVTSEWRSRIADVMDKEKGKVKNHYQTHLHCASLPESIWQCLDKVFSAWKRGDIKKQPCKEAKQTHFTHLFRIHDEEEKQHVLLELASGTINFRDFKDVCRKRTEVMTRNKVIKANTAFESKETEQASTELKSLKEKEEQLRTKFDELQRKNVLAENKCRQVDKENSEISDYNKELENRLAETERELDLVQQENSLLKQELKNNSDTSYEREAARMEKKIKYLQDQIKEKDNSIKQLQEQVNIAEDAANRARKGRQDDTNSQNEKPIQEQELFTKGETVTAFYSPDGEWYDAVIIQVLKKGYKIKYVQDNFRETISSEKLKKKV